MNGTDQQRAPEAAARLQVIRASAGTGKTYQLSSRYVARLRGSQPDQILATTFTRKAAGEILERILKRLADAVLDTNERRRLSAAVQGDLTDAECRRLLSALARSLHRVRVATLDSFFANVASAFALELALPNGWRLLDELEDKQLRLAAVESVLARGARQDLMQLVHLLAKGDTKRGVTALIQAAVDDFYGAFLEAAPEAWSAIDAPPPLTADRFQELVEQLRALPLPADSRWEAAHRSTIVAAESGEWEQVLRRGIANKLLSGEAHFHSKPISDELRRAYGVLIRHAGSIEAHHLSQQLQATHGLLDRFHEAYAQFKRDARGLTFDDITRRLADVFAGPDADRIGFRLDAQIDHLLLDEFQDTSLAQWQVLEPIAESVAQREPCSFFCVGDVKQAIYGWRGGVAEIFETVQDRLPNLRVTPLDVSYRSAEPVIETVNQVFSNLDRLPGLDRSEPAVRQWTREFPRHSTTRTNLSGYACLAVADAPGEGETAGDAVVRTAARRVAELLPQLPEHFTIGVLTRRNPQVGRMIYELGRLGIRASEEGGNRLVDSAAVQAVLSALRMADHPGDTIARFHVAHSPLGPVLDLAQEHDDAQAADIAEHIRRSLIDRGYGAVLHDWMLALAPSCDLRGLERLGQLVTLGEQFEPQAGIRPGRFLDFVEATKVEDPRAAQVRVMTIHRSKGLEFDVVILPELDVPLLPRRPSLVSWQPAPDARPTRIARYRSQLIQGILPREIQEAFEQTLDRSTREALCILYVALTRAVRGLWMFVSPEGSRRGLSFADLLCGTLAPNRQRLPGSVLYEAGSHDWSQTEAPPAARPPAEHPPVIRFVTAPDGRRRGREFRAPSRTEDADVVIGADLLSAPAPHAADRGTLIHKWFEQIEWLAGESPGDAALLTAARGLGLSQALIERYTADFRSMIEHPTVRRLLSRSSYLDDASQWLPWDAAASDVDVRVMTERRFDVAQGNAIISGSIDRLCLFVRGERVLAADILDYKTDAAPAGTADPADRLAERYALQLGSYAEAVGSIYGLPRERIATHLVWLTRPTIITVAR